MQPGPGEHRSGGEQDLGPFGGGHRPQPARLLRVHPAGQPGVDQHEPQRPGVDGAVGPGLDGVLGVRVAVPAGGGELLGRGGRRPPPEQASHQPGPGRAGGGRRGRAGVGRGAAEDGHEAGEAVVPVVGPGDAVDRGGIVGVGRQQPLLVGAQPARGRTDVAARHRQVGVARSGEQDRRHGLLGRLAGAGVAENGHGNAVEPREPVDDPVGRRLRLAVGPGPVVEAAQPQPAGLVGGIAEQARQHARCARRTAAGAAGRSASGPRAGGPSPRLRERSGTRDGRLPVARRAPWPARPGSRATSAWRAWWQVGGRARRASAKRSPLVTNRPPVTRLSGVDHRRGVPAADHDRRRRARVPEGQDRARAEGRKVDHGACRYGRCRSARPPVRSPSVPTSRRPVRICAKR